MNQIQTTGDIHILLNNFHFRKGFFPCLVMFNCWILFHAQLAYSQLSLTDKPVAASSNPTTELKSEPAMKNIKDTTKKITLATFVEIPTHSILISTGAGRSDYKQVNQRIQYNPTFGPNLGISAAYDLLNMSFRKRLSFISEQEVQTYGQSNYDDFRLALNFSKYISVESYYQNYRGFYTDLSGQEGLQTSFSNEGSTSNSGETIQPKQIISRPDIEALNYGIRSIFTFPLIPIFEAFSVESEKNQQNGKGDWDFNFLTKLYYNRLAMTGNQPLVPASKTNSFSPIASLKEHWANTFGAGAGLGVIVSPTDNFIFGFDAILGAGLQRQTNVFSDHESVAYTTAQEMNSNLYMGWKKNNHRFHFGLYMDTFSSKVDDINFDASSLGLNLAYSYSGL